MTTSEPFTNSETLGIMSAQAATLFNKGDLINSQSMCEKIIATDKKQKDAHHILGLIHFRNANFIKAEECLQFSIFLDNSQAAVHNSLGLVLAASKKVSEAMEHFSIAIDLDPMLAEAKVNLASILSQKGLFKEAEDALTEALSINSNLAEIHNNLGDLRRRQGAFKAAIGHFQDALDIRPAYFHSQFSIGLTHLDLEQWDFAREAFMKALEINPKDPASLSYLGFSLQKLREFQSAADIYRELIELDSSDANSFNNLANVCRTIGLLDEAKQHYEKALSINPDQVAVYENLGHLYHETENIDAALAWFDKALEMEPHNPQAHHNKANAFLLEGRIAEAWSDYEWRFRKAQGNAISRPFEYPVWDGSALNEATLLLWAEQGVGDELLYASILNEVIKVQPKVIVECDPRLVPLFKRSFPSIGVYGRTHPPHQITSLSGDIFQRSFADLCPLFRPSLAEFLPHDGYLTCDAKRTDELRARYRRGKSSNMIVGISWRSNQIGHGYEKSINLTDWLEVLKIPGITFVNLQYGDCEEELAAVEAVSGIRILHDNEIDPLEELDSFASQVSAMDLVITTSNTTAHMAGALNIPVWTLVPRLGTGALCWYWFRDRIDSPWYPSMSIFRQEHWGRWHQELESISSKLSTTKRKM